MFERFNEDARRTVVRALVEARLLGHPYVGTEHTLIALAATDGAAADALASQGVTVDRARAAVSLMADSSRASSPWDDGPYTARAKHTFELGMHEAFTLGHQSIASGHLLLALLRLHEGNGVRALESLGVDLETLRLKLEDSMSLASPPDPPSNPRPTIPASRMGIQSRVAETAPAEPTVAAAPAHTTYACSFCSREMGKDDRFVAAAGAVICAECAAACARLLSP
jgi:ATP-dependent Clp protease ATP-binding subunit ClpC